MENWEPLPPRWENISEGIVQNHKHYCKKFIANFPIASEDIEYLRVYNQFRDSKIIRFVYDSNNFENAGVDAIETQDIWEGILSERHVPDPSVRVKETLNHFTAYLQALRHLSKGGLSTLDICKLHKTLMRGIDDSAGRLRTKPACVGMYTQYPDPSSVPMLLEKVLLCFNDLDRNLHVSPYAKAAWLKCRFVEVHPFEDGNGRLSRILLNWVLFKYGIHFPVAIASDGQKNAKKHYMQSLKRALSGRSPGNFSYLVLRSVYNSIKDFESVVASASNSSGYTHGNDAT